MERDAARIALTPRPVPMASTRSWSRTVSAVDAIVRTTGSTPVPEAKAMRGYRTLREKFERAGLTPIAA